MSCETLVPSVATDFFDNSQQTVEETDSNTATTQDETGSKEKK